MIYYLIGLDKRNKKIDEDRIKLKDIMYAIIFLLISIFDNIYIFIDNEKNYEYATSQLNILNMFWTISLIPIILKINNKYKSNRITRILEQIGENSFGIYFIHIFVLNFLNYIWGSLEFNFFITYFIKCVMCVIISYLFIIGFKKITKNKVNKYLGF